jgi:uncharacterized protein YciI
MSIWTRRSLPALLVAALAMQGVEPRAQTGRRPQFVYVLRVARSFHELDRWTDAETGVIGRHFARLAAATASGRVLIAGRTMEALPDTFGLVIFEADDVDDARRFMAADPAVIAGLMTATLHPYQVALQRRPGAQ